MADFEHAALIPALTGPADVPDWRELALCAQVDPELWFPESGQNPVAAKLICGRCELRPECLAFALVTNAQFGVWGGFSADERRRLRRQIRRAPALAAVDVDGEAA
jgi:WhiB family redox-sensing transcriptional regulator